MTNQELIRKLQKDIAIRSKLITRFSKADKVMSAAVGVLEDSQKLHKKLLAALYKAERVERELEDLEGSVIGFISRLEN